MIHVCSIQASVCHYRLMQVRSVIFQYFQTLNTFFPLNILLFLLMHYISDSLPLIFDYKSIMFHQNYLQLNLNSKKKNQTKRR